MLQLRLIEPIFLQELRSRAFDLFIQSDPRVYEPAPVVFRETEVGHLPFVYHNSALVGGVNDFLWWNFTDHDRDYFFSKWLSVQAPQILLAAHCCLSELAYYLKVDLSAAAQYPD